MLIQKSQPSFCRSQILLVKCKLVMIDFSKAWFDQPLCMLICPLVNLLDMIRFLVFLGHLV